MFWYFSDRVYLNTGEGFFPNDNLDLLKLLDMVAYHVKVYQGENLFEQDKNGNYIVYYRRTKRCIVKETNKFIDGLNETIAEESAISHVSITQINRLIRALKNRHGRITCYAEIILHVCLSLIASHYDRDRPIDQDIISKYTWIIHALSESYYAENADPLAHFLLQCAPIVSYEVHSDWKQAQLKGPDTFPPIPKRNPTRLDE